jgi:hypothetical protein
MEDCMRDAGKLKEFHSTTELTSKRVHAIRIITENDLKTE